MKKRISLRWQRTDKRFKIGIGKTQMSNLSMNEMTVYNQVGRYVRTSLDGIDLWYGVCVPILRTTNSQLSWGKKYINLVGAEKNYQSQIRNICKQHKQRPMTQISTHLRYPIPTIRDCTAIDGLKTFNIYSFHQFVQIPYLVFIFNPFNGSTFK